ncbi:MAG: ThuA domain-containing protein [Pyrinomonadaceae bacterium]|nr:ThuA domain-containing protein [Pyrinomonadaceae bacterium]
MSAQQTPLRPHVVFVTGDHEYSSEGTMPIMAKELERNYRVRTTVLQAYPDENAETNIPGLEALDKADLAIFFLRWRQLPKEQVEHIRKYLESGRPIVAFRTTTHAFNYPKGHELETWNAFAADSLGGPPGWGKGHFHYGHKSSTDVRAIAEAINHPVLKGVDKQFHVRSWLYHVLPKYPPPDATLLLMGKAIEADKKDAVDNPVAWTWKNKFGGKVFMTTLGHPDDFKVEAFQRLVINAVHWTLGKPVPAKWAGKIDIDVAYHGIKKMPENKQK